MSKPLALVVDDDPIQRQILAAVLAKFGITSQVVASSKEFIQTLKTAKPDFCMIDLNLEGLGTGFTIVEAVRKVLGPKPVLIIISGNSDRNAIAHALELGANDFIVKPFDRDVLNSKLSHYVSTDELKLAQLPLLPVPENGSPASLNLEFEVVEIDEFGLKLASKHLISKGLALQLEGEFLGEVTGQARPPLFTVTSTWVEPDGTYGATAEFDLTNVQLKTAIRKWLTTGQR